MYFRSEPDVNNKDEIWLIKSDVKQENNKNKKIKLKSMQVKTEVDQENQENVF